MVDWIQSTQMNQPFTLDDGEEEDQEISFGSFRADVVGIRYYNGKVNNREMVSLRREPQNRYDRNAIRVDNVFGQQVGHIKREQAAALAPLVDKKYAKLEGVVPFGNNNKFSMPCDVTLRGLPEHMERCQDMMQMKGYKLNPVIQDSYSDGAVWREMWDSPTPSQPNRSFSKQQQQRPPPARQTIPKPSYAAKSTSSKELVHMTSEQMQREIDSLFDNTFDKDKHATQDPCECVKVPLYPHQKQALSWMISRENNEALPPFWEKKGKNYTNSLTNFTSPRKPEIVKGGILADDMGLGKTLSIISLIVTNYRNGQPLVNIDKSSSVQHTIIKKKPVQKRRSSHPVRKPKESFIVDDDDEAEDDNIEEPLPSFSTNEDVDYKPASAPESVSTSNAGSIASKRSRRTAAKKPRYNFEGDDWLCRDEMENQISPAKKKVKKQPIKANKVGKETSLSEKDAPSLEETPSALIDDKPTAPIKNPVESPIKSNKTTPSKHDDVEETTVTAFKVTRVTLPGPRATLIVCPLSVMSNWQDQFESHLEYAALDVYAYYGSDRTQNPDDIQKKDVILTTYQTLSADFIKMQKTEKKSTLHQVKWLRIVLDEGHCIRNMTSNQSKACIALESERRWIVTGTPIQNSIKDLHPAICFLRMEPLNKKEWWERTIERPLNHKNDQSAEAIKRLQAILLRVSIRRTKQHKVDGKNIVDLPPKKLFIQYIELSKDERKLYDTFKNEGVAILQRYMEKDALSPNYAHMLVILMRLRQLCCHPKLCAQIVDFFDSISSNTSHSTPDDIRKKLQQILSVLLSSGDEECPICLDALNKPVITHCAHLYCRGCIEGVIRADKPKCPMCRGDIAKDKLVEPAPESEKEGDDNTDGQPATTWSSSSKVDGLITLLNKEVAEAPRRKHLVVSQFSSFLNLLEKPLRESGFHFTRLDGSMTMRQRTQAIASFSSPCEDSPTVMLLSLKAGGVGLNLTAATRVFLMDPAWNPAAEDQCFDRCHRLGQTEEVKIYKFVVKDSVEQRMQELQEKKRDLMNRTFGHKVKGKDRQQQRARDVEQLLS